MAEPHTLTCPATVADVRRLAEFLRLCCEAAGVPEMAAMELELATVEAANNIAIHGYRDGAGRIAITFTQQPTGVAVMLEDHGAPIPPDMLKARRVPDDSESGRGMAIIAACVDTIDYTSDGSQNRLTIFKATNFEK